MKKIKKVFAILLSLAMVLGMGMTSFAAETTNVLIEVAGADGAALNYVQIVEPDTKEADGWKIVAGYEDEFEAAGLTIKNLIEAGRLEEANANANAGTINANENLGAVLEALKHEAAIGITTPATKGGLYLINAQKEGWTFAPMLAYVPVNSTDPIAVSAKGEENKVEKTIESDGASVAAGDVVKYTVKANYPYFSANYKDVLFKVTDTLTNATFTIDEDHPVEITVDDQSIALDEYTLNEANGTETLTVDFNYDIKKAGGEVKITYFATVSEGAMSSNPLSNKVVSETSTDKNGTPETAPVTKTEYEIISTPVKATIFKTDAVDNTKKLAGATFALYKGELNEAEEPVGEPIAEGTTDEDGNLIFEGLDAQETYYIVETEAPDGYKVDKTPYKLTGATAIDPTTTESTEGNVTKITTTYTFTDFGDNGITTMLNTTLSSLPSTGGIGTTIFTIGGCLIMIVAAALFFSSRKKSDK